MSFTNWKEWTLKKGHLFYKEAHLAIDVDIITKADAKMKTGNKYTKQRLVDSALTTLLRWEREDIKSKAGLNCANAVQVHLGEHYKKWLVKQLKAELKKRSK